MPNGTNGQPAPDAGSQVTQASAVTAGGGGLLGGLLTYALAPVLAKNPVWQPVAAMLLPTLGAYLANIFHQKLGLPT